MTRRLNPFAGVRLLAGASLLLASVSLAQFPQPVPINLGKTTPQQLAGLAKGGLPETSGTLMVKGVKQPVKIVRDRYGVAHIYAKSTADLFFAQGYTAAQDRMWQLEMWRRIGEGRLSEVLGPDYVERDRFARTIQFRGNLQEEMTKYHPEGQVIFESFARGVNAAIIDALESGKLPIEFQLMGFNPEPVWTSTTLLNRMVAWSLTRNASAELARALALKGATPAQINKLLVTDPKHNIVVPEGLNLDDISPKILEMAKNASDLHWKLQPAATAPSAVQSPTGAATLQQVQKQLVDHTLAELTQNIADNSDLGSNNWVIGGSKSVTGMPLLANDPHREVVNPGLRDFVHLNAPGWNVIGATEPGLPGVSIGHNDKVAWSFTILGVDQEDLYVETVNPEGTAYQYQGKWVPFSTDRQLIRIKGKPVLVYDVKSTQHGPVLYMDKDRHRAYAMRWVGSMAGGAGYLGSLNVLQAKDWDSFTKGVAKSWYLPSHSLVYADVSGNYGYLAAAAAPVRPNWDGMLPVPGNEGKYEWKGIEPLETLPRELNGKGGFYASANNDIVTTYFPHYKSSLGYEYTSPYRFNRITEVLNEKRKFSIEDMEHLQFDHVSLPARQLVPLLKGVHANSAEAQTAIDQLLKWNDDVAIDSVPATIYEFWYFHLAPLTYAANMPDSLKTSFRQYDVRQVIAWLTHPDKEHAATRNEILAQAMEEAVADMHKRLGTGSIPPWGKVHTATLKHPLENAKTDSVFHVNPVARGGDATTVQATSGVSVDTVEEMHGASAMFIMDTQDWDRSVALNAPGNQSTGGMPHSTDLAADWGTGKYFPLAFSDAKVNELAEETMMLAPFSDNDAKESGAAFERVQTDTFSIPAAVTLVFGDYDNDGWPDMYVGYRGEMNRLYHNEHGKFVDVTLQSGITDTNEVRSAAWGDYNGDGLLDLYVGFGMASTVPNRLYRNDGNGHFTEVALESGIFDTGESRQITFVDYDNDGAVDLAVAFREKANKIYHNDGHGHFTDVSKQTGLDDPRKTIAGVWFDYNASGHLSLFEANQNGDPNGFYVNDGHGHFTDKAKSLGISGEGRGPNDGSVGLGIIDFDNDGHLDVFAANYGASWLLKNDGKVFHDIAPEVGLGISAHLVATGWGDYDNDGKPDLYADGYLSGHENIRDYLWHNEGGTFRDVTPAYILKHDADHAVAWVDFDNDGALDLALADHERQGGVNLYRNLLPVGAPGRSLAVLVLDDKGHFTRAGAEVKVYRADTHELLGYQIVDSGSSYSSQSALPLYFGFAKPTSVDVEVINLTMTSRKSTWRRGVDPASYHGKALVMQTAP